VHIGKHIQRHETDIVAMERIFWPRIAKADPELHQICPLEKENPARQIGGRDLFDQLRP
jgi:hypothetical protein